jgi:hypothetical protein
VFLHARKKEKLMLDIEKQDKVEDEERSLFHVLKRRKRCRAREIQKSQDHQGNIYTQTQDIVDLLINHLTQKYKQIDVDPNSLTIMEVAIPQTCPSKYVKELEAPITYEEITTALKTGAHHNAPGIDGISLEFYTQNWDIIKADLKDLLNQMFSQNKVSSQQKHAIIINLPKANGDPTPEGYRPISLLTTEYKILARIMAQRLRPIMKEQLSSCQFCAVPGNSILEAVAKIRDAITWAENTGTPLCVLTLDFESAFDKMSHSYLFKILRRYGITQCFIERIRNLYNGATASIQINGTTTGQIPIRCAVGQGCPLSMALCALCLHPLLRTLEETLNGLHIGGTKRI